MDLEDIAPAAILLLTIAALALLVGLLSYGLLCYRSFQTFAVLLLSMLGGFAVFYGVAYSVLNQLRML